MKLIVAFENPNLFHLLNLKKLSLNRQKLIMICPYDFIYYFFSLRNRFLFKPFIFFTNNMKSYLLKNIPNLKLKVEKPNIFHIIYFFPISLIKTIVNLFSLIKILRGNKAYLYSNGVDITGYCLDSLQRFFGKKFLIENENNLQNIIISFFYLLFLEIYLNWFYLKFKNRNIQAVLINHEVYAECGMFAEYSKIINKSQIYFLQSTYNAILKISNVRKSIYDFLPNVKIKNKKNKNISWYDKNAIIQNQNFTNKKVNLNRVLIIMHAFCDASGIYSDDNPLFQTTYHWIKKTLEIAKSLDNQHFIFRAHPGTYSLYQKDKSILFKLFKNTPNNIELEDPRMVNHMHHFENEIPIMVTFKGSIILEMGCSGINIVSISSRFPCDCPIIPNSLEDYRKILNGEIELNKIYLNDNQINNYLKQKNKIINALERIQQIK